MSQLVIHRYKNPQDKRKNRTRSRISLPKLVVSRSNKYISGQVVDKSGHTVAGVKGKDPAKVGQVIAERSLKLGIKSLTFDRGPYQYHGRVKQLAEAARQVGLKL